MDDPGTGPSGAQSNTLDTQESALPMPMPSRKRKHTAKGDESEVENDGLTQEEREAEDFNEPSSKRKKLLGHMDILLGGEEVPDHFRAICNFMDIDMLVDLVKIGQIQPSYVKFLMYKGEKMAKLWAQKSVKTSDPTVSTPTKGEKAVRSRAERDKALERDGKCCVITKEGDSSIVEVVHIYPHNLLSKDINSLGKRSWFWRYLAIFWPEDKIREWKLEIFPDDDDTKHGVDSLINLVTTTRHIHAAWNEGMIALKPIELSPDRKTMKLQFLIQERSKDEFSSITTEPESSRFRRKHSSGFKLHVPRKPEASGELPTKDDNTDEWVNLKSGDFIEWTTNDPEKLPLPSFKLLEMQWFLNRVIGMAGAGKQDDDDFYDDDLESLADDIEDEEVD